MICPLCKSERSFLLREYDVAHLRKMWKTSFGFDPFPQDFDLTLSKRQCSECHLIYFSPEYFGDAKFYSKLSCEPFYYEGDKWEFDAALKLINELHPSSLLEVGCGDGLFLEKVEGAVEYVQGLDINERAVQKCQAKGLCASTTALSDMQRKFDMVLLFEVLEHLEKPAKVIASLLNVLESNGVLIIAVPNPDGYLKEVALNLLDIPPHHNSSWSKETFDYLASKFDLKKIDYECEPLRYVHYTCYLGSLISSHKEISRNTMKSRLLFKLQGLVVRFLAPLTYLTDRNNMGGQTHLVAFRRK